MSGGDVRVLGLVMGTHVIEDIGMDVPHGMIVAIPGEKALLSKDLYRAISSKCIAQLPSAGPPPPPLPQRTVTDELLIARIQSLEERNRTLEVENGRLQAALQVALSQQGKLDDILAAIQSGAIVQQVVVANGTTAAAQAARPEIADGTAPQFIPSEIKPKDAETRIEVQKDEAAGSSITDARERLRRMRQQGGQ